MLKGHPRLWLVICGSFIRLDKCDVCPCKDPLFAALLIEDESVSVCIRTVMTRVMKTMMKKKSHPLRRNFLFEAHRLLQKTVNLKWLRRKRNSSWSVQFGHSGFRECKLLCQFLPRVYWKHFFNPVFRWFSQKHFWRRSFLRSLMKRSSMWPKRLTGKPHEVCSCLFQLMHHVCFSTRHYF